MAENEGEAPRFDPKHRIIGAIILVALAVIFIPMILDESHPPPETKPAGDNTANPTAPETKVVVAPVTAIESGASAPAPATAAAPAQPAEPAPAKPADAAPPAAELAAKPEPDAAQTALEAKSAAERPVHGGEREKAAREKKGWIVQIGVYSHADNAKRSEAKLRGMS
jgi:DedD protein